LTKHHRLHIFDPVLSSSLMLHLTLNVKIVPEFWISYLDTRHTR
jgi:hypothetical protein